MLDLFEIIISVFVKLIFLSIVLISFEYVKRVKIV